MLKFAFIILHYKTIEDTIQCIESILKLQYLNKLIVVVDNNSENSSGYKLKELYGKSNNIYVIINKINMGFARGNNIGIEFARKQKSDFVCILNNDTKIEQVNFIEKCVEEWKNHRFEICGPKIISLVDGGNQNPFIVKNHFVKTITQAIKMFIAALIKYLIVFCGLPRWWEKGGKRISYTEGKEDTTLILGESKFLLYGACIIFSPDYFRRFNGLCKLTFMYEEETILYFLCSELSIKTMYIPQIVIYHNEQSSTKNTFGEGRKKLLFQYGEDLKSRGKLLRLVAKKNNKNYLINQLKEL